MVWVGGMMQAAWVAGQYADIAFVDQRHFTMALHRVVAALTDEELPVRVDSVVALRTFVEACKGNALGVVAGDGCSGGWNIKFVVWRRLWCKGGREYSV